MNILDLLPLIEKEMAFASDKYGPYHNSHEHLGVYLEEFEEWKDCVKDNTSESPGALYELIQGAAVCLRYIIENGDAESISRAQTVRHET